MRQTRTSAPSRAGIIAAGALAASLALAGCTGTTGASPSPSASASGEVSIANLLQLGIASAQAGDNDQAAATFKNVLALDPGNAYANYNLGVLAQQVGDTAGATKYYDAAISTNPKFTSAMYNKAIILESSDRDGAIALYRQIVGIDDKAATAYFRLSSLLQAKGDPAGASDARQKALALDPSLASASPSPAG